MDESPLSTARRLASVADVRDHYRRWAPTYDVDVFDRAGVVGSRRIAEVFAQAAPCRTAKIVDLGCGTGAVGRRLAELGYTDVTGVDLSPEMIARAGLGYRRLVVADLRRPPVRPGAFDASVSAGTFTTGHLGGEAVGSLLALVRPHGIVAWTVAEPCWQEVADALERSGATVLDASVEPIRPRCADPDADHQTADGGIGRDTDGRTGTERFPDERVPDERGADERDAALALTGRMHADRIPDERAADERGADERGAEQRASADRAVMLVARAGNTLPTAGVPA